MPSQAHRKAGTKPAEALPLASEEVAEAYAQGLALASSYNAGLTLSRPNAPERGAGGRHPVLLDQKMQLRNGIKQRITKSIKRDQAASLKIVYSK